jgi:hypothetical protein
MKKLQPNLFGDKVNDEAWFHIASLFQVLAAAAWILCLHVHPPW